LNYFFAHWYFILCGLEISKVYICVWNDYNGDSETVNELARHTALKRWIAREMCWYIIIIITTTIILAVVVAVDITIQSWHVS